MNRVPAASVTLSLRLKVRPECYAWLNAAALEVNQTWNFCNERAATVLGNLGRWLSGFDLCYETAGSTQYMKRIGADTIQRVCTEYAPKLARTRLAKAVLDSGWGMLRQMLQYKGEYAGRSVEVVSERNTSRVCSQCGSLSGPQGLRQLAVRAWTCSGCGEPHDRDVNAARNILARAKMLASVSGNEPSDSPVPSRRLHGRREAGTETARTAA